MTLALQAREYSQGLQQQKQATQGWGQQIKGIFQDNWNAIKGIIVGALATALLTAALAVIGFVNDSMAEFQRLESGMAEVFSIMPGVTEEAMGQMTEDVMAFSSEVGRTADETVPALYQALSSGVPPDNVFDFMQIASDAALGGVTDLETAVDGITSAVNAYGAEVLSAQEASDLMFQATVGGKTTFEELSQSLYNVIPTAASLNLEFSNVTAALAAMTAQGTPTSVATTQLRQLLVELSKAGGDTSETFERMAGQSFVDFIASGGNLQEALQLMEQAAAESGVRLSDLFSSVEAGNAALSLTGSGAQKFSDELLAAADSAEATDDAAAVMADTMQHIEDVVAAQTSELKILIAEGLAPTKRAWLELKQELLASAIQFVKHNNEINAGQAERDKLVDQLKQIAAETDNLMSVNGGAADSYDAVNLALLELSKTYPAQNGNLEDMEMNMRAVEAMTRLLNDGFQGNGKELAAAAIAAVEAADAQAVLAAEMERTAAVTEYMTDARRFDTEGIEQNTEAVVEQAEALTFAQLVAQQQTEQLALLSSGEREMTFTTQAAVTAAGMAAETNQLLAEKTREAAAAFAGYFVDATNATNAVGLFAAETTEAGTQVVSTTVNQDSLNAAMYDAAIAAGGSAEQLAILGLATGQLTEDQAEAALKTAILMAEVNNLAAAYVAGDLSISELRTETANLVADVNAMDVEIGASTGTVEIFQGAVATAGDELVTAADRARGFATAAEEAAGDYSIHFDITQTGSIPNVGGDGGAAHGGYQPGFAVGGFTGYGPLDQIAGFVHRGEYVLPPEVVNSLGLPFLEMLRHKGGKFDPAEMATDRASVTVGRMQPVTNNTTSQRIFNLTANVRDERAQSVVIGSFRRMERIGKIKR